MTRVTEMTSRTFARGVRARSAQIVAVLTLCLHGVGCSSEETGPAATDTCKAAVADADGWYSAPTDNDLYIIRWQSEPAVVPTAMLKFTVEVSAKADGAPVSGALTIKGFMPDHGHGFEGYTPVVTPVAGQTGAYNITGVVLAMLGRWELTFNVQATAGEDAAKFTICL